MLSTLLDTCKAIIFDFDGVILDSEPLHYKAAHFLLASHRIEMSYSEYAEKYLGLPDETMFPLIFEDYHISYTQDLIDSLINEKNKLFISFITTISPVPLVLGFDRFILKMYTKNIRLGICTGCRRIELTAALSLIDAGKYINSIVTIDDIENGKPSPEGYIKSAENLNVAPANCLVFEDSPTGILAAKNAGMQVVALATTHTKSALIGADIIIHNFMEC